MFPLRSIAPLLVALTLFADAASADGPGRGRRGSKSYACESTRAVWVPARLERVERRRWVAGGTRREWIPAETRKVCSAWGVVSVVVVRPGRWVLVSEPGRYEVWYEEVWVPGTWTRR